MNEAKKVGDKGTIEVGPPWFKYPAKVEIKKIHTNPNGLNVCYCEVQDQGTQTEDDWVPVSEDGVDG